MALEVPAAAYDFVTLPLAVWCAGMSTGWLVAGEWMATNVLLKSAFISPWDQGKETLATALGGVGWIGSLAAANLDIKGTTENAKRNRCLLGTGSLIFAGTLFGKNYRNLKAIIKVACGVHTAAGLFLCFTKPKAEIGGTTTVYGKSH